VPSEDSAQSGDNPLAAGDLLGPAAQETRDRPVCAAGQADAQRSVPARERPLTVFSFAVAAVVLFTAYYGKARTIPVGADSSSNALEAWDMLHGNLLLHGWTLSDVSFYTTELPEYALVEAVRGLGPDVVYTSAALTYTLVVLLAALLARGRATGRTGLTRALIGAGIMLAPTWNQLLSNPDHTGTQAPLLLAWLIVDRCRPRWWIPAVIGALLALAQMADTLTLYEGVLPLAAVCAGRIYRRGLRLPVGPEEEPPSEAGTPRLALNGYADWYQVVRANWYEAALATAGLAGALASTVGLRLLSAAGGFTVLSPRTLFAPVDQFASRVGVTAESILTLYSANFSGHHLRASIDALLHLAGLALAVWALARAYRRFWRHDLVTQVLAVAAGVLLVAYTLNGNPSIGGGTHEIIGLLPIGAVLAGRLLGPPLARLRLLPLLAVVLILYAAAGTRQALHSPVHNQQEKIGAWLAAHHLDQGLATYWDASPVTFTTREHVRVRPVSQKGGTLTVIPWQSAASWYDPQANSPTFFLLNGTYASCPDARARTRWLNRVTIAFGPPAKVYQNVDGYDVLVWQRNLLTAHIPQAAPHGPIHCL
jgi:hypothetical protein